MKEDTRTRRDGYVVKMKNAKKKLNSKKTRSFLKDWSDAGIERLHITMMVILTMVVITVIFGYTVHQLTERQKFIEYCENKYGKDNYIYVREVGQWYQNIYSCKGKPEFKTAETLWKENDAMIGTVPKFDNCTLVHRRLICDKSINITLDE